MATDLVVLDGDEGRRTIGAPTKDELEANTSNLASIVAKLNGTLAATQSGAWTVTQSGSWTVAATQSGTWNVTNISGTVSLPTGASTAALQTTGNTTLSTIATDIAAVKTAVQDTTTPAPVKIGGQTEYETVAASQTAQVLGATGATGDFISHLLVIPASTSPGNVILLDNATSITVFAGGASSVSNLAPFAIPLCMLSVSGAWKVTTGANVSVIAVGDFT